MNMYQIHSKNYPYDSRLITSKGFSFCTFTLTGKETIIRLPRCNWSKPKNHEDVVKWKHFPRYWPLWGESPHKGQWRGALIFLWSAPEQTFEQSIKTAVIWDTIAIIVTSLYWRAKSPHFVHDWPWLWPWIKSISNKLNIAFRVRASQLLRHVMYLWRHQLSTMTSLAERNPSEWKTGLICKDRNFFVIRGFITTCKK